MRPGFRFDPTTATLLEMGDSTHPRSPAPTLTANESLLWHAEAVRGQFHPWFGALVILGREPTPEAFDQALGRAIQKIPRLRHHVVSPNFRIGLPEWRPADLVDVRYHARRLRLQPDADLASALGALSVIAALPMDRARPLWECYLLGPMSGGRSLCLFKFHGALIDSIDLTELLSVLGSESNARRQQHATAGSQNRLIGSGVELARDGLRRSWKLAAGAAKVSAGAFRHPVQSFGTAWRGARAIPDAMSEAADLVAKEFEGVTATKAIRHFDLLSVPTAVLEKTARPLRVTPEDLLLAALTAALRALKPPAARRVVDTSCIARLRPEHRNGDAQLSQNVLGSMSLPIGERRESRRLAMIRDARQGLCAEGGLGFSPWLAHALGVLPRSAGGWVIGLGLGSPAAGFFDAGYVEAWGTVAGCDIDAAYGFADLAEAAALSATVLRAGPLVHVGIAGDARLPTDSRSFRGLFDNALEEMEELSQRFARGGKRYSGGVGVDVDA
jgi:diacylglycerol O-acyltransferase